MITESVRAFELWSGEDGVQRTDLDITGKWSTLYSRSPDDKFLYPDRTMWTQLYRIRAELNTMHNDWINSELAYEHRATWYSDSPGALSGGIFLPLQADAPYRITQLDWKITEHDDRFSYHHEIDRMLLAFHPEWGQAVVGRQAIGLGRGVMFGAIDIFSPFNPLEIDRQWRRGVDAVRVEYQTSDTTSVEVIMALDENWDESALIGRLRGYVGNIDGELIFGKRGRDDMIGAATSAAVGDAEVHLEGALFDTPEEQPHGGTFGDEHLVVKAVAGASYTFDIGNGLTVLGEYHYSGFGMKDISEAPLYFLNPEYRERYLRGDTQILSREALGYNLSYSFNETTAGAFMVIHDPSDGSGVVSPSVNLDLADNVSLTGNIFIPWGDEPSNGQLKSTYGGTPLSVYFQLSMYF